MSIFLSLCKWRYDDAQIVGVATQAIQEDPAIENPGHVAVTSKNGVVRLAGWVGTETQLRHIEAGVNGALQSAGLKHARIVSKLAVSR